jgi:hypothetical protein
MEAFNETFEEYKRARKMDDLMTPHACTAAYTMTDMGTLLDDIEPFTTELTGIVESMKEELANEVRLLEGMDIPEYMPDAQNELSQSDSKDEQWSTPSLSGCWTTGRTLTSTLESNTLFSTARPNSPVSPTLGCVARCSTPQTNCCKATLDVCGCATDAMNESSECTVPTTSELMPGMPSEEK